eukprot:TRINITY_DN612_c1_g1_i6.p1 TRINITY_DN612_c1_g1~~TRINITY_DN612_c1_g1_i6.p1  ORF type:complete len:232 (-),score=25.70 TRINITY_DN612_c1_g1_i6:273-944(-)
MTIKVYGFPVSTATLRVVVVLQELGLQFELVSVSPTAGEAKTPDHLKRQPFGQIPVLEDGEIIIYESRAIIRYLANTYGGRLYGTTSKERALVEQWLEVESQNYNGPAETLLGQTPIYLKFRGIGQSQPEVVEAQTRKLKQVLEIYDAHLAESKYLAGDGVTLADLVHLPITFYLTITSEDAAALFRSYKNVLAWWTAVSSLPSWQKVLAFSKPYLEKLTSTD